MPVPAILLLENEEPFHGVAAGAEGLARGAVVASAASAGQPDLLTDPAYGGKIVCFTYPHIGTAGVVPDDLQSGRVAARAVVARELGDFAANRLGVAPMTAWLAEHRVPAIVGVDTRSIAQIVARRGHIRAIAGTGVFADAAALAREFSARPDAWREEPAGVAAPVEWTENAVDAPARTVVVYDFGVKRGFLRRLAGCGCRVRLVPSGYPAEKALAEKPDAVVFSSGAGSPGNRREGLPAATGLLGKVPLWGVGVGAGVLAVACGARTTVDGLGHYGVQPVCRAGSPLGEMTAQAHDFWLDEASLAGAGLTPTYRHLNDGSVEGFACEERGIMGVLFNPEAEPGPRDSLYLFETFFRKIGHTAARSS